MKKVRLNNFMLRLAACFIDYESAQLVPSSRIVEYPYVFGKLAKMQPGNALDVGCVALHNYVSPSLAINGWKVTGVDIRPDWAFKHPNFTFVQGDIRNPLLFGEKFDAVFCVSTLEHIGLSGYYGNKTYDKDGDIHAIYAIRTVLKEGGQLVLTVPYKDTFLQRPGARVYDMDALNGLLGRFDVTDKVIYALRDGAWQMVENTKDEGVICLTAVKR